MTKAEVVRPACWDWPLPTNDMSFYDWHDLRCSFCGVTRYDHRPTSPQLVLDHDHNSTLVRGYLCNSCNIREGHKENQAIFRMYYALTPAMVFGLHEQYPIKPVSLKREAPKIKPFQVNVRLTAEDSEILKSIALKQDRSISYTAHEILVQALRGE